LQYVAVPDFIASSATWFLNKKSSRGILLPFLFLEQKKRNKRKIKNKRMPTLSRDLFESLSAWINLTLRDSNKSQFTAHRLRACSMPALGSEIGMRGELGVVY
jgi:hypothetical protein